MRCEGLEGRVLFWGVVVDGDAVMITGTRGADVIEVQVAIYLTDWAARYTVNGTEFAAPFFPERITVWAGRGHDTIALGHNRAGIGSVDVYGGKGDDRIEINGVRGATVVRGNSGNDVVAIDKDSAWAEGVDDERFEEQKVTVWGGPGDDEISGGLYRDLIFGGAGDDTLVGRASRDTLHGDDGNDCVTGGTASDVLWGGLGRDTVVGDEGDDTLGGGSGRDRVRRAAGSGRWME